MQVFLILIVIFLKAGDCDEVTFTISDEIKNNGFHRNIVWTIGSSISKSNSDNLSKCLFALHVIIPSGMFLNPDEIADMNRKRLINAYIDGTVNVEAPEHESKEHSVLVFLDSDDVIGNTSVSLPVHLRYHKATLGGGFAEVVVPKPTLLVKDSSDILEFFSKLSTIRTVCDSKGISQCIWRDVPYQSHLEDKVLLVPVGNLEHYPLVAITSLVLGCVGCIYLLSIVSSK